MIEAFIDNFSRTFFDFTDVDEHSGDRIASPAKNKIGSVISTAAVARGGFRTKRRQVLAIGPRRKEQPARGRELKPFADRQKHDAANILRVIIQRANPPDSTLTYRFRDFLSLPGREWSESDERHGRLRREGSGRALREAAEIQLR